jgi:hypothetical protein
MDELDILNKDPPPDTPLEDFRKTLSYNAWNADGLVNWADFEDVTRPSRSHGKDPVDNEETEDKDEDENENEESNEYEDSNEE